MKWINDGFHIYCPTCAVKHRAQGCEPDFEKLGCDHCEICGMEYFNTPPGILKRFKERLDWSVGHQIDDLRVGTISKLLEWFHLNQMQYDLFITTIQEILDA